MNAFKKNAAILCLALAFLTFSSPVIARALLGISYNKGNAPQFVEQLEAAFNNLVTIHNYNDKDTLVSMLTRFHKIDAALLTREVFEQHKSSALIAIAEVKVSGEAGESAIVLTTHSNTSEEEHKQLREGYQELLLDVGGLELLERYAVSASPQQALVYASDENKSTRKAEPGPSVVSPVQKKHAINQAGLDAENLSSSSRNTSPTGSQPTLLPKETSDFSQGEAQQPTKTDKAPKAQNVVLASEANLNHTKASNPKTKQWQSHIDLHGKLGNDRTLGEIELFMPLVQNLENLLFLDLRFQADDNSSTEGNFGLGYRKIFSNRWILGGYGFYDQRKSEYNNKFNQTTLGLEALTEQYDARINIYLADNKSYLVSKQESLDQILFSGFNLVHQTGGPAFELREKALSGFDAELGWLFPWFDSPEVRGYLGVYHFSASGIEDITGPRGRVEVRFPDILGWTGALFELGGEVRHDDVRDTDYFISARGRIPFGSVAHTVRPPKGLSARMTERIQRDPDIVVSKQQNNTTTPMKREILTDGADAITFTHVNSQSTGGDGSVDTPFNTLADAETLDNDIILLHADSIFDGEGIILKPNQRLLGGSLEHTINTDQLGLVSLPRAGDGTQAPVIQNVPGPDPAVELGDASEVSGIVINNADIGIFGSNIGGINVNRNRIVNVGDGILLEDLTPNTVTNMVYANTIVGADYDGISVYNSDATGTIAIDITDNRIEDLGLATIYGSGIYIENNGQELRTNLSGNTIINSYDEGLLLDNEGVGTTLTASVSGNKVSTTGFDGMAFINNGDTMNLTVLDNQVQDVATETYGAAFANVFGTTLNLYLQGNRVDGDIDSGYADYQLYNPAGSNFNLGATTGFPDTVTDTDNGVIADEDNTRFDPNAAPLVEAAGNFSIVDKTTIPVP